MFSQSRSILPGASISRAGFCAAVLLGMASLLAGAPAKAQEIQLNLVTAFPFEGKAGDKMYGIRRFIERFNEEAEGKAQINVIGGPEVISPLDHLKALQTGQFDISVTSDLYFAELKDIQFLNFLPFERQVELAPTTMPLLQRITREVADIIFLQLSSPGIPFYLWTKEPVGSLEDSRGMKIRPIGQLQQPMREHLGIVPVMLPSHEIYNALRSGLIDGAVRDQLSIEVLGEGEFLKYRVEPSIAFPETTTFISAAAWDELPADIQDLAFRIARETEAETLEWMAERTRENEKVLSEQFGVEVVPADEGLTTAISEAIPRDMLQDLVGNSKYKNEIVQTFGLEEYFQ
jgi:TRAP-type transport system periplasmic protein